MGYKIYTGDVRAQLAMLPEQSVQCCVTSPPYWGLRDYGTAGQIGLEATPDAYVQTMVEVFREVRRVLKDDGTLWLNLGDSYSSEASGLKPKNLVGIPWRVAFALQNDGWYLRSDIIWHKPNPMPESVRDRPTKSHEYVFLLTKSERYYYDAKAIAELAVSGTDMGLLRSRVRTDGSRVAWHAKSIADRQSAGVDSRTAGDGTRNVRSVWTITTKSYKGAHFATFPEALPERCIKAGSRGPGKMCDCDELIHTPLGTGDVIDPSRHTGRAGMNRPRRPDEGTRPITRREQRSYAGQIKASPYRDVMKDEAGSAFAHYVRTDMSGARPIPPVLLNKWTDLGWLQPPPPCECPIMPADTVLDPFTGSGTTGKVAIQLGRNFVGCELNPTYAEMARQRIGSVSPLFSGAAADRLERNP